jgi:hypothetical protein
MTEHSIFGKQSIFSFLILIVGELLSRDPTIGKAYLNIVRKIQNNQNQL